MLKAASLAIIAVTALYSQPARAREEVLVQPRGGNVLIWKSGKPHDEAMSLLASGVLDAKLLAPLLACRVPSGTRAVVSNGGIFSSDVIITTGPETGCRGTTDNENFSKADRK